MTPLEELTGRLEETHKKLAEVFDQAGPDLDLEKVDVLDGDTHAKVDVIRQWNKELEELHTLIDDERTKQDAAARTKEVGEYLTAPIVRPDQPSAQTKTVGEQITESDAVTGKAGKGMADGPVAHFPDWTAKTLMETGAGWDPQDIRIPRWIEEQIRPVQLLDIIPTTTTRQTAVVYMEETTFTNNAAEVSEGPTNVWGEAALALTQRSDPVQRIGTYLPVTDEQLEDVDQIQAYINNRLSLMVRLRLDSQILNGNGTAPNLRGILNRSGIQTIAKGTDTAMDVVHKAITLVNVTGRAMAGMIVIHSNDWQQIRLTRTADGIYILGNPADAGMDRLWGLPIVKNEAIAENTVLVGDFRGYSELSYKRGVDIQVSNSHTDYFAKGQQAIRADLRAALVVYRPAAFCTATGV